MPWRRVGRAAVVSGKAADLARRDAEVLGGFLKIRSFPLAGDNAEGYTVTDVDGRRHLDFVVGDAVAHTVPGASRSSIL